MIDRFRVAYAASGTPTAVVMEHDDPIVDYTLFWTVCQTLDEGYYLTAIINSDLLYEQLKPLMPKGQFGARHVQKHLGGCRYRSSMVAMRRMWRCLMRVGGLPWVSSGSWGICGSGMRG